jgi:hypothetical protein
MGGIYPALLDVSVVSLDYRIQSAQHNGSRCLVGPFGPLVLTAAHF